MILGVCEINGVKTGNCDYQNSARHKSMKYIFKKMKPYSNYVYLLIGSHGPLVENYLTLLYLLWFLEKLCKFTKPTIVIIAFVRSMAGISLRTIVSLLYVC